MKKLQISALATMIIASCIFPAAADNNATEEKQVACPVVDYSKTGKSTWALGLYPTDDLISVWCRIQNLPGNVRFNILFPTSKAHKSWDTKFEGNKLPPEHIVKIVQSLLPTSDGPAKDENGMEFHKVLQNVTQLAAEKAPSGHTLSFAPEHPAARRMVLWEPIILRIRPVSLAGQEFTMAVTLVPNLGVLSLALQGQASDLVLQGWKGRMNTGGIFGRNCSDQAPLCEDIPETVSFHAPWIIHTVELESHGENMTAASATIMNQLLATRGASDTVTGPRLNPITGEGSLSIGDDLSHMELRAEGSANGTKSIKINWRSNNSSETSVPKYLKKIADVFRSGKPNTNKSPSVPDSLNLL